MKSVELVRPRMLEMWGLSCAANSEAGGIIGGDAKLKNAEDGDVPVGGPAAWPNSKPLTLPQVGDNGNGAGGAEGEMKAKSACGNMEEALEALIAE